MPDRCPECGGDLSPFVELAAEARGLIAQARVELLRGEFEAVLELADRAALLWDELREEALLLSAEALVDLHRLDEAEELLSHLDQESEQVRLLRGRVAYLRELERTAMERFNAGLAAARRGYLLDGLREFAQAVKLAPHLSRPHLALAEAYLELERPERALEVLEQAPPEVAQSPHYDELRERILLAMEPPPREEGRDLWAALFPQGFAAWLADNTVELRVLILLIWLLTKLA